MGTILDSQTQISQIRYEFPRSKNTISGFFLMIVGALYFFFFFLGGGGGWGLGGGFHSHFTTLFYE